MMHGQKNIKLNVGRIFFIFISMSGIFS